MSGNAWEWVSDWFDQCTIMESPEENPQGTFQREHSGSSEVEDGIQVEDVQAYSTETDYPSTGSILQEVFVV